MKVLVTVASRYGATAEIATAIGEGLRASGIETDVVPVDDGPVVDGYDAVVLGSAVYAGHWLPPAKEFVVSHAAELTARPVWLFSSGPIGDPPKPKDDPVDAEAMIELTAARGHQVFAGKLDRGVLGLAEKAIAVALRAPYGDFREWDAIAAWASEISTALRSPGP